ncbi:iron-containing redox enzyme family protein [Sorangium sp. So ce134]
MNQLGRKEIQNTISNNAALPVSLAWGVRFEETADGIRLEDSEMTITLASIEPARCRSFLDRLDGEHSVSQLAGALGIDAGGCAAIVACLVDNRMARRVDAQAPKPLSGAQFAKICRDLIPGWKSRLFGHPMWRALSSGDASRALFEGWLLENFHFIEGVTLRLSAAVAHCGDPALRKHFIKHFAEEYDHCEFFRRALAACGISDEEIAASPPLAATQAVLSWARDAARKDPLCYAACSAFLESTGADRESAKEFFERMARSYEPRAVKLMAQHAQLDEKYGHAGFLEKICEELGDIEAARAERAIQCLWGFVETLELWSTCIQRYHASATAVRPAFARPRGSRAAAGGEP